MGIVGVVVAREEGILGAGRVYKIGILCEVAFDRRATLFWRGEGAIGGRKVGGGRRRRALMVDGV